ncbi:MAG TPA: DedA family protein [Solirubrobacteraceae bacterium]|nr:DedA family protein [Solirubrobacteraceae bacterium]
MMFGLGAIAVSSAAILGISNSLGYLLPAIIGLESMGIPSPGETALVAAAVLASQGKLEIWLVILIGVCSAIVGDNIGYLCGRRFGRSAFTAPGPFMHHRVRAIRVGDKFFERHGPKAVFVGRWIALVRFATAWLAGINRMPFKQFFFWNALGGITWGVTYGLVGYYGGQAAASVLAEAGIVGFALLLILPLVIYLVVQRRGRRAAGRASD